MLTEQARVQALDPCTEALIQQGGPKVDMYLRNMWHIENGKQPIDDQVGACFLAGFPACCGLQGFSQFHETGRKCPCPVTGLYGPLAQQDTILPLRDATRDDLGILIVHQATIVTDVTQTVFTVWLAEEHPGSTMRTIVHDINTKISGDSRSTLS